MAKRKVLSARGNLPETWEEAMKGFLFWKQAQGMSQRTLKDYRKHISQLFNHYPEAYNPSKLKLNVLEYMAKPVKPATFNLRLVYILLYSNQ
ncbi:MAG: hypothetical protein AB1815_06095 [Bacillota bacterium]|jgi:nitric oxide synthase oxygenase domain/subunit